MQRVGEGMRPGVATSKRQGAADLGRLARRRPAAAAPPAHAVDEIQVYTGEINEVGQFSVQQHLNYTIKGLTEPAYPGALIDNHALNGTPEFAYGVTPWLELGLYVPFAVNEQGQFLSNNFKLRTLFVTPGRAQERLLLRPEFRIRLSELAVRARALSRWKCGRSSAGAMPSGNSSSTRSSTSPGAGNSAASNSRRRPGSRAISARTASSASNTTRASATPGNFESFQQQSHKLFAVTDFKVGEVDVDFGIGYGLTPGSDRWVVKTIISYAFPVPGKKKDDELEPRNDEIADEPALDVPAAVAGADGAKSAGGPAMKARGTCADPPAPAVAVRKKEAGMRCKLMAGAALAAISAGSAFAADLPVKAVAPAAGLQLDRPLHRGRHRRRLVDARRFGSSARSPARGSLCPGHRGQRTDRRRRWRCPLSTRQARARCGRGLHLGQPERHQRQRLRSRQFHGFPRNNRGHEMDRDRGGHLRHRRRRQLAAVREGRGCLREHRLYGQLGGARNARHSAGRRATRASAGRPAPVSSGRSRMPGRSRPNTTISISGNTTSRSASHLLVPAVMPMTQDRNHINQFKAGLNWRILPNFW